MINFPTGQVVWPMLELLGLALLFVIALGMVVGIFTYGKPIHLSRKSEPAEAFLVIGIWISHRLIDLILGKRKRSETWLDDEQLIAMLRGMRPSEFEEFIAQMFSKLGYKTELVGGSGDGGVDIEMTKDGRQYLVQCKKFITRKVTPHDVRDFYGAMGDRRTNGKGFFITTNIFTVQAEQFAEGKPLELIDGTALVGLVRDSGVLGKSAKTAEEPDGLTCPRCGSRLVVRKNRKDGMSFLGCSAYPKCKYTENIR